jgi:hypothetical protein
MFLWLALLFPGVLLVLLLAMERVELPLRDEAVGDQLIQFLDSATATDVEVLVSEGLAPAMNRYWRRRSLRARLLPGRLITRA